MSRGTLRGQGRLFPDAPFQRAPALPVEPAPPPAPPRPIVYVHPVTPVPDEERARTRQRCEWLWRRIVEDFPLWFKRTRPPVWRATGMWCSDRRGELERDYLRRSKKETGPMADRTTFLCAVFIREVATVQVEAPIVESALDAVSVRAFAESAALVMGVSADVVEAWLWRGEAPRENGT